MKQLAKTSSIIFPASLAYNSQYKAASKGDLVCSKCDVFYDKVPSLPNGVIDGFEYTER